MTKLGGSLSLSLFPFSLLFSFFLPLSLPLPSSLFNKLVSQSKTNDRALAGLWALHFHLLQHECKVREENPGR